MTAGDTVWQTPPDWVGVQLEQLERMYGKLPIGLVVLDRELRLLAMNEWFSERMGRPIEAAIGKTLYEVAGDLAKEFAPLCLRVIETGEALVDAEATVSVGADVSELQSARFSYLPVLGEEGEVLGISGVFREITRERGAERALQRSEADLRQMADSLPALIAIIDGDLRYRFINRAFNKWYGVSPEQAVGRPMREVVGEAIWGRMEGLIERVRQGEQVSHYTDIPIGDGHRRIHGELVPRLGDSGEFQGYFMLAQDVTEAHQAAQALAESEAELRARDAKLSELTRQLLTAQEEERTRIARELHDDLTQQLAAVAIEIGSLERELPPNCESARRGAALARERLVEMSQGVRRIARNLHPSILDDLGLAEAIRSECRALQERAGIRVAVTVHANHSPLPPDVELGLYRVAQESLRNVSRHACAEGATVVLEFHDDRVALRVEDTGVGFDKRAARARPGMGLASMEERVRLLDGELEVVSVPGAGTTVHAVVPLSTRES